MKFDRRIGDGSSVPVIVNADKIVMMLANETHRDCTLLKMDDGDDIVVCNTLEEILSVFERSAVGGI